MLRGLNCCGSVGCYRLSSHTTAEILPKVAGIAPLHHVAVFQLIAGAAVVGIPAVDIVHPTGETTHVKLVEVVDPLYIGTVIYRSPVGFHVDGIVPTYPLEDIEYALALAELHLRGRKNNAVRRHKKPLAFHTLIHVVQDRFAGDGEGAGVRHGGIHRRVLWLYWVGFTLRNGGGHVLIPVAGILRLLRLRLAAGRAGQQQEKRQKQRSDMSYSCFHITAPS